MYPSPLAVLSLLSLTSAVMGTAAASDCIAYAERLHPVAFASLGGDAGLSMTTFGGHLYATASGFGGGTVLDITDPDDPIDVGSLPGTEGFPNRVIHGAGDLLLMEFGELLLADASDPASVSVVATLDLGRIDDAVTDGALVWVAARDLDDDEAWLWLLDATVPASPVVIGSIALPAPATELDLDGDVLFLGDDAGFLTVADVSMFPPTVITRPELPLVPEDLALGGGLLLLQGDDSDDTLVVVDVTDPATPVIRGSVATPPFVSDVAFSGGRAFLIGGEITVVDVSDPDTPVIEGHLEYYARDFKLGAIVADHVVTIGTGYGTFGGSWGLAALLNVGPLAAELGSIEIPVSAVEVSSDLAFVAGWNPAFAVVDLTDPTSPSVVGSLFDENGGDEVAVLGDRAYLLGSSFHVINVSVPDAPAVVGSTVFPGSARSLAVRAGLACIASSTDLVLVDVTGDMPAVLGTYPGDWRDVAVRGSLAFVTGREAVQGLRILDVSTPGSPSLLGSTAAGRGEAVATDGVHAFVARSERVTVFDVTDPAIPTEVAVVDIPGIRSIELVGEVLHVGGDTGLTLLDVSDPADPQVLGGGFDLGIDALAASADALVLGTPERLVVASAECQAVVAVDPPTVIPGRPGASLHLSPSPFTSRVTIRFHGSGHAVDRARAEVLDVTGRLVARVPLARVRSGLTGAWDGTAHPPGVYFVRVEGVRDLATRRVVRID
jgi:hypothetical protein